MNISNVRALLIGIAAGAALTFVGAYFEHARAADFAVVHDTGGDAITITGNIDPGDAKRFASLLKKNPRVDLVSLTASFGGDWFEAVDIGRAIHRKGLYTLAIGICKSACAYVWLAGSEVYVMPGAESPKFHLPYGAASMTAYPDIVAPYIRSIGLPGSLADYIVSKSLSAKEAVVRCISQPEGGYTVFVNGAGTFPTTTTVDIGCSTSDTFSIPLSKLKSFGVKAYVLR